MTSPLSTIIAQATKALGAIAASYLLESRPNDVVLAHDSTIYETGAEGDNTASVRVDSSHLSIRDGVVVKQTISPTALAADNPNICILHSQEKSQCSLNWKLE